MKHNQEKIMLLSDEIQKFNEIISKSTLPEVHDITKKICQHFEKTREPIDAMVQHIQIESLKIKEKSIEIENALSEIGKSMPVLSGFQIYSSWNPDYKVYPEFEIEAVPRSIHFRQEGGDLVGRL